MTCKITIQIIQQNTRVRTGAVDLFWCIYSFDNNLTKERGKFERINCETFVKNSFSVITNTKKPRVTRKLDSEVLHWSLLEKKT